MTPHEVWLVIKGMRQRLYMEQAIAGWAADIARSPWMKHPRIRRPPIELDDFDDTSDKVETDEEDPS